MNARARLDRNLATESGAGTIACFRIRGTAAALTLLLMLAAPVKAAPPAGLKACAFPEPPRIPDGCAAADSTLDRRQRAVRRFVTGVEESLACIEAYEASLDDPDDQTRAWINAVYNNGVDQMHLIAEAFNEQVRRRNQGCSDATPSVPGADAMTPDQVRGLERSHQH